MHFLCPERTRCSSVPYRRRRRYGPGSCRSVSSFGFALLHQDKTPSSAYPASASISDCVQRLSYACKPSLLTHGTPRPSARSIPDWKRTSPSAGEEGGRPGTHESTFAGAAGLATPHFTSVVLCGSERRARCSPRACLASGTGKLRVGRHRPDDRGRMGV